MLKSTSYIKVFMRSILFLILVALTLGSCRKEEAPVGEPPHVPGQVLVVLRSDRTLAEAVELFNGYSLPLLEVHGFHYRSPRGVEEVKYLLSTKSYLRPPAGYTVREGSAGTFFITSFYNLDPAAQASWAATLQDLQAEEVTGSATQKWVLAAVPPRSERQWIGLLERHPGVQGAEYNYRVKRP